MSDYLLQRQSERVRGLIEFAKPHWLL